VAQPVSPLVVRRIWFLSVLVVFCALALAAWSLCRAALEPDAIYTGLLLIFLVVALTLFNARKKLPFLRLIRAAVWLQVHIYAGWFCLFVFLLHIHFRVPRGAFEIVLALVFCIVILSGIFGLYISRELPDFLLVYSRNAQCVFFQHLGCYSFRNRHFHRMRKSQRHDNLLPLIFIR
jgi:hypothetical protein